MPSLGYDITIEHGTTAVVSGASASDQDAVGRRTTVFVFGGGIPDLLMWDTVWSTGERELVLARPDPSPAVPMALANLFGRRRAMVEALPARNAEYMTVRAVVPDTHG